MTNGSPVAEAGKWFAGSFTLAGTAAGFVGLTGGDVDRILLNHPWMLLWSVLCLVLAVVIGAMTPVLAGRPSQEPRARRMLLIAAVLLVGGLVWLDQAASQSVADNQRPKVTASFKTADGTTILTGTATASGVRNDEHVEVRVWGRSAGEPLDDQLFRTGHPTPTGGAAEPPETPQYSQLLLGLRSGPDQEGKVKLPFEVPVGNGLYEQLDVYAAFTRPGRPAEGERVCRRENKDLGCVSIWVPVPATRPRLASSFDEAGVVTVKVDMAGAAADDVVALRVRPLRADTLGAPIYSARLPSDGTGSVTATLKVPVPEAVGSMCVIARHLPTGPKSTKVSAHPRCSPGDPQTATTLLTRATEN
jgi:hypothetical protein